MFCMSLEFGSHESDLIHCQKVCEELVKKIQLLNKIPHQEIWDILTQQMEEIEKTYPDFKYKDREEVYSDVYAKLVNLFKIKE